jgi:Complex1_LYR-like
MLSLLLYRCTDMTPPERLYRRLLRRHRYLSADMRSLGDVYLKSGEAHGYRSLSSFTSHSLQEFRRHKNVTNPGHIIGFLSQWKVYLDGLPEGPDAKSFSGEKLDPIVLEKVGHHSASHLVRL